MNTTITPDTTIAYTVHGRQFTETLNEIVTFMLFNDYRIHAIAELEHKLESRGVIPCPPEDDDYDPEDYELDLPKHASALTLQDIRDLVDDPHASIVA